MKNFLKVKRWEAGMKQYELASILRCSAPYLSMVENGRIDPSEEFKQAVANLLSLSVDEIFPNSNAHIERPQERLFTFKESD
jgi:DNA-binding XRE family transcriptional regulator